MQQFQHHMRLRSQHVIAMFDKNGAVSAVVLAGDALPITSKLTDRDWWYVNRAVSKNLPSVKRPLTDADRDRLAVLLGPPNGAVVSVHPQNRVELNDLLSRVPPFPEL